VSDTIVGAGRRADALGLEFGGGGGAAERLCYSTVLLSVTGPPKGVSTMFTSFVAVLKPREQITLPGDRKMRVRPEDVTADRALLWPEGTAFPVSWPGV
jgi:hypothetical protein